MRVCSNCNRLYGATISVCPDDGATVPAVTKLAVGTRVGQYEIVGELGEGGMGMVYEAVHEVLGRRAAMKFLRKEWVHRHEIVARFLQEARAVNTIDHDSIINVYDYGDGTDGAVYFVMEYLEGQTLLDFQHANRPLPLSLLFHIYRQIMSALAAAHAEKIVHRDLKPANVFLIRREDNEHFVKLLDFGVAKVMGEGAVPGLTSAGSVLGTPEYMSPEQIAGRTADERSDIYSLGAMIYDTVVGRVPFNAPGFGALARQVLTEKITAPSKIAPPGTVPAPLERWMMKALERERENRFQTVSAMLAEFDAIAAECGIEPPPPPAAPAGAGPGSAEPLPDRPVSPRAAAPVSSPGSRSSRVPLIVAVMAAVAAIAVGVTIKVMTNEESAASPPPVATADAGTAQTVEAAWSRGDLTGARALARASLVKLLADDNPEIASAAGNAIALAATPALADLLYAELGAGPQRKANAARALGRLGLPEAGPKLRATLQSSGGRLRIELAAALLDLGDRDAVAILERGLEGDPRERLLAASALARAGIADRAQPVLAAIFKDTPAGRPRWLRAGVALSRLGDEEATRAVRAELANPDASRSAAAADELARAGDATAITFLERVAADESYGARPHAALALAGLGKPAALGYMAAGLASEDANERLAAAAIAARLGAYGADKHGVAVARMATRDPDDRARAAALAAVIAFQQENQ